METQAPQLSLLPLIVFTLFSTVLLIVPTWIAFKKAGKHPALSLFLLIPFPLGLWIVMSVLAFSKWPNVTIK